MTSTKDNWIKAFDKKFVIEQGLFYPKKDSVITGNITKQLKAFISQVEKDAKSESYTNGFRDGFDAGVEKTNKRWRERVEGKRSEPITDFGDSYWRGVGREEIISDLLEDTDNGK